MYVSTCLQSMTLLVPWTQQYEHVEGPGSESSPVIQCTGLCLVCCRCSAQRMWLPPSGAWEPLLAGPAVQLLGSAAELTILPGGQRGGAQGVCLSCQKIRAGNRHFTPKTG
jgi:hypothetical protein